MSTKQEIIDVAKKKAVSEKKQVAKNLLVNIASFLTRMLIGLWLAPYLVTHVGVAAYGFVAVASIITEYLSIITGSVHGAMSRFMSVNIQRGEFDQANKILNTSLIGFLLLIVAHIPVGYLIVDNIDGIFSIPAGLKSDVVWLVIFTLIGYAFSLTINVFAVPMFALNRLDLMQQIDIVRMIIRIGVIVICFTFDKPSLVYVGVGELSSSILTGLVRLYFGKKLAPWMSVNLKDIDKSKLRELVTMSGWIVLNFVGFLMLQRTDIPVVNRFIGAHEAGQYAAVAQWSMLLSSIIYVFSSLTAPLVLAAYAKDDYHKIEMILLRSIKILGVLTSLFAGLIMAQSENLLKIWVGEGIDAIYPLLILMLAYAPVNLSVSPLQSLWAPLNRVKVPGIMTFCSGLLCIGLSVTLAKVTNLGIYAVAIVVMSIKIFRNVIFLPLYASRVLKIHPRAFYKPMFNIILATGIVFLLARLPQFIGLNVNNWPVLIGTWAVSGLISLPILWKLIFTAEDREFAIGLAPQKIKARFPWLIKLV
ncbi:MAG: oligosaccharide flippase family protein [Deltaproteobacteria bacterium]|nr:oligosaccharide flippase family protein [Deltaproteobacteria bacterium]